MSDLREDMASIKATLAQVSKALDKQESALKTVDVHGVEIDHLKEYISSLWKVVDEIRKNRSEGDKRIESINMGGTEAMREVRKEMKGLFDDIEKTIIDLKGGLSKNTVEIREIAERQRKIEKQVDSQGSYIWDIVKYLLVAGASAGAATGIIELIK